MHEGGNMSIGMRMVYRESGVTRECSWRLKAPRRSNTSHPTGRRGGKERKRKREAFFRNIELGSRHTHKKKIMIIIL